MLLDHDILLLFCSVSSNLFSLQAFFEKSGATEIPEGSSEGNKLIVAITSDRGLCGAVHTNVSKAIRNELASESGEGGSKVVCVGDKSRALLQRYNISIIT